MAEVEKPFDISIRLDDLEQTAYPFHAVTPSTWRELRQILPSFRDTVDNPDQRQGEGTYTADVVYSTGKARYNTGILEVSASPLTSHALAMALSRYEEVRNVVPYAPFGLNMVVEALDEREEVVGTPGYFLVQLKFRKIPYNMATVVEPNVEPHVKASVRVGARMVEAVPNVTVNRGREVISHTTTFLDSLGVEVNSSGVLVVPNTEHGRNLSVQLGRSQYRRVQV